MKKVTPHLTIFLFIHIVVLIAAVNLCYAETVLVGRAPHDVISHMLEVQRQLVGYSADGYVNLQIGKLRIPRVSLQMTVKRPASITLRYLGLDIKPKYPLLPDPESLKDRNYDLQWSPIEDDSYYVIDALPKNTAPCPYEMTLWVNKRSNLLERVKLIDGDSFTYIVAKYRRFRDNCWIPESLSGNGGLLIGELLPLPPVKAAIKLLHNQDTISYTATFSNIKLFEK